MNEEKRLLYHISLVDFVLTDLSLYLDTHAKDHKALEYFLHYSKIKKQLMKEFESKYYPLQTSCVEDHKEWTWGLAPNPWEGVC